eukprot:762559-Hanusia_phi.AAC.17
MSHSIAQYTGTRIDSSAKHIMQCRVNHDFFTKVFEIEERKLVENKYRYAMQKDELVLDVGAYTQETDPDAEFKDAELLHAYPSVITTLGDGIKDEHMNGIRKYYRNLSMENEDNCIVYSAGSHRHVFPHKFGFVGVSLGTAYASDYSGDNVGSVLIGGMATVLNGHFQCYTGELVQWYFDFERGEYDSDGFRLAAIPNEDNRLLVPASGSEDYYKQRMFGAYQEVNQGKYRGPLIKPYRPMRNAGGKRDRHLYGDRVRIVGRIVNGGMPWEPIDIFLSNTFI